MNMPYMTVYLIKSLPKIACIHHIYIYRCDIIGFINDYLWSWPSLLMCNVFCCVQATLDYMQQYGGLWGSTAWHAFLNHVLPTLFLWSPSQVC